MRNRRLLILAVLIVLAFGWLYFVFPTRPQRPQPAATPPPPALAPTAAAPVVEKPPVTVAARPPDPPAPPTPAPVATAEPAPADEAPVADAESATPAADPDRAADLFADQLAKQEAEPVEGRLPDAARDLWKRFDKEQKDDDWSAPSAQHLEDTLDAWIDDLPDDSGDHVVLVHVDCRSSLCQVLAADNDLNGQGNRAEGGQEWQQAIAGLRGAPWWNEAGFTDVTTQVTTSEGYVLYTTYLLRGTPAPPQ